MKITTFALATALAAFACVSPLFGEDKFVEVVQTGYGASVVEAKKAALHSAVEAVVGTLIDAKMLVENDELIEDEVLTYSAGMVEKAEVIGEPKKGTDGIYAVKVKATVKKNKLEEKLHAVSAVNMAVNGEDLFARMVTAQNEFKDSTKIMKAVLDKWKTVVVANTVPGDNGQSPIDIDPKTHEVFLSVSVRIDKAKYRLFANEILEKFKPMSQGISQGMVDAAYYGTHINADGSVAKKGDYRVFIRNIDENDFIVIGRLEEPPSARVIKLDDNRADYLASLFNQGYRNDYSDPPNIAVRVTVTDRRGDAVVVTCKGANTEGDISLFGLDDDFGSPKIVAPVVSGRLFYRREDEPVELSALYDSMKLKIPLGKFEAEELENFANVKVDVGWMCDGQFREEL